VPTAVAPDGDRAFDEEGRQGVEHFASLGLAATVLTLRTREDALRPEITESLASASMVFFAGGHPEYLAAVPAGPPAWETVVVSWERGAVVAAAILGDGRRWEVFGRGLGAGVVRRDEPELSGEAKASTSLGRPPAPRSRWQSRSRGTRVYTGW
jgi:hypothetical protein